MFVAQELRKKNIAEYLLYMWQVEDTIRAFGCSLARIRREYIDLVKDDDSMSEDYQKNVLDDIEKVTGDTIKSIDNIVSEKEKEIMSI